MTIQSKTGHGTYAVVGTIFLAAMMIACEPAPTPDSSVGPQGETGPAGQDGRGCKAAPTATGGWEITCPSADGGTTVLTVTNGQNGANGTNGTGCTAEAVAGGFNVTCPGLDGGTVNWFVPAGSASTDGGTSADGGSDAPDAGETPDAGTADAGSTPDGGTPDAGQPDAGEPVNLCVGVTCLAAGECQQQGACEPATGACAPNPPKADDTLCTAGSCRAGVCINRCLGVSCPASTNGGCVTSRCIPAMGACIETQAPRGTTCNDGNACTGNMPGGHDYCMAGQCLPGAGTVCQPGECTLAGVCDPQTGACTALAKPEDTLCAGGVCRSGVCTSLCVGVTCAPAGECLMPGTCDPQRGYCSTPAKPDGVLCSIGSCQAGACVNKCAGVACATPVNTCQASECNPATGACSLVNVVDGIPCDDGNACTGMVPGGWRDHCQSGVCAPGDRTVCSQPANQCQSSVCNPTSGVCEAGVQPIRHPCDDGNACTLSSSCNGAGVCVAAGPVVSCDDGNDWTQDSCVSSSGCTHTQSEFNTTCTVPVALAGTGRYCEVWTMWGGYDAVGARRDDMANNDGQVWVTADEFCRSWWTPVGVEVQVRVFGPGLESGQWVGGSYASMLDPAGVVVPLHEVPHPWTSQGIHNYGVPVGGMPWCSGRR